MKISIKITKDGLDSLNNVLQQVTRVQVVGRDERVIQSILEEVYRKVYQALYGFAGNKPKKVNMKFYQASTLEVYLRNIMGTGALSTTSKMYHEIRKIADELHQLVV